MKDWIDLGSAPREEQCAQVGTPDYRELAHRECRAYISQLRRLFGEEPEGARLEIRANPHDFDTYYSVVCGTTPQRRRPEYAFRCEAESPAEWDDIAKAELCLTVTILP